MREGNGRKQTNRGESKKMAVWWVETGEKG